MSLDRDLTPAQFGGHFFVQETSDDPCHNFALATCEGGVPLAEPPEFRSLNDCLAAAIDRAPDRLQQHIVREWLGEELNGSGFHRTDSPRNVTVTRDEDDRNLAAISGHTFLKLETVEARQFDVQQ
jgi:hypothetical protein